MWHPERAIQRCFNRPAVLIGAALPTASPGPASSGDTATTSRRNTRPLSVPILIETRSRFIVWLESALSDQPHQALARDLMGRLRRRSWLVSKKRRYLDLGLQLFAAYRNLVRRRFNRDDFSPAQFLGFTSRRLRVGELLGWRQDWGERSPRIGKTYSP